ncbi:MAG: TonB-dependent receptor [Acidimicrobiales bacterium]|nr:TonB-dependent receptor [Hyphomonadaceae bacterium]RZV44976.1 MAG: TonB-dependent receptor [Acidimicrobiales bacterium]
MKRFLLITAALGAISTPVLAQSEPTEETEEIILWHPYPDSTIITVGQRSGFLKTDEATSPSTLITLDDLENRGSSTVADFLRTVPGASVNRSGPAGSLTQLRLRGAEANQTLVLIDGVEVSNPNTGEFDFASLRSEDVIKIEVLRGEQSALWGSDALGGVINIITSAGTLNAATLPEYQLSVEGGSFNTGEAQVSARIPLGLDTNRAFHESILSINGNLFSTDGYDISGSDGDKDGSESRGLNIGLNHVDLAGIEFSAKYSAQHAVNEFDSDTDFNGRLNDIDAESETDIKIALLTGRFELVGFDHTINLSHVSTDQVTSGTSFKNDTAGKRTTLNWVGSQTWDDHTLTLLAETEEESFSNFGGVGGGQNQEQSIRNNALAGDYRFDNDALTLSVSARQDFNDMFDDSLTWRAGVGYNLENLNGRVRGSVGTGVKNPTMTEIFGFFPAFFVGNPDIQPEKSLGYNIGYEQSLFENDLFISVDYFRSDLENEILTDFSVFPSTVINLESESQREGVEIEGRWNISEYLSGRASVTFLDTEENGVKELRRPEFQASGTLTWDVDPFSLTLSADHTGSQIDTDFATFSRVELDSFTLLGLNAVYHINDIISVSLRGENLLDENYQEVVGYASQGRGFYAGLRADF